MAGSSLDFEATFGIRRSEFEALPGWKQRQLEKVVGKSADEYLHSAVTTGAADQQSAEAATKVQSVLRGRAARAAASDASEAAALAAEIAQLQAEAGDFDATMSGIRAEVDQRADAATKVQSLMRGKSARAGGAANDGADRPAAADEQPRRPSMIDAIGGWFNNLLQGGEEGAAPSASDAAPNGTEMSAVDSTPAPAAPAAAPAAAATASASVTPQAPLPSQAGCALPKRSLA